MNRVQSIDDREVVLNWRTAIGPLAALLLFGLGLWNLGAPALWWDEGWTLSVARTWVERGHYGRLLNGQLAPPGLEASFTVTAPIALAFRLFGVGIWQGRLFGVLCTIVALVVMYQLALRLYNRPVAIGTLAVLLLLSMHPQLHPLIMGRQVLAEMPMLCYLLAGYACLPLAFRRPLLFMPLVAVCWGIALITKAQVLPFWALSIAVALLWSLLARRWKAAALLLVALLGSYAVSHALVWLWLVLLRGHTLPATLVSGLYEVLALVPGTFNRLFALSNVVMFGLPTLLGLCYAAWRLVKDRHNRARDVELELVRVALLVLAGSWFAWFVLLSVGVPRYLFPATFVGSIFVAALLSDLTDGYSLSTTIGRCAALFRRAGFDPRNAAALLAIVLIAMTAPITIQTLYRYYLVNTDSSALQTARFLDTQTASGALVETYESELHFLLNRRYHYPPDQLHVELNRRSLLAQDVAIDYDPLAANPDYLVVGTFSRGNGLYERAIAAGAFRPIQTYGGYTVYERAR